MINVIMKRKTPDTELIDRPSKKARPNTRQEDIFDYYRAREEETTKLAQLASVEPSDNEEVSSDQLCWKNIEEDDARCETITGFSCEQFRELLNICEPGMADRVRGRGRRRSMPAADRLLLVLCHIKHYETLDQMEESLKMSKTKITRYLHATIQAITPILYQQYVEIVEILNEPTRQYVLETTFQEIWCPIGERSNYHSDSDRTYGVNTQKLHDQRGFMLHCVPGVPAATSVLAIAKEHLDEIRPILGHGELLLSRKHKGLEKEDEVRARLPHSGRTLNREQVIFNRRLVLQREIAKRWNKRLRTRFRIMSIEYRSDRVSYELTFKLCAALTNYSLISDPL